MNGLLLLIPIALLLGAAGLVSFVWALQSGQFDDLDGEGSRILFDDEPPRGPVDVSHPSSSLGRSS